MTSPAMFVLILLGVGVFGLVFLLVVRALGLRGPRLVTCPETRHPTEVALAAGRSAVATTFGHFGFRLRDCSRWPEREGCGQFCLAQIEEAPADCLVVNILRSWYEGKVCSMCGRAFGGIEPWDHKPAFLDSEGRTWGWNEIPIEAIPAILDSHEPVCWDCHTVSMLYRLYPDRIVERPDDWQEMSSLYR